MENIHENLHLFYPPTPSSNPPISALDRFLTDQTHFLQLLPQNINSDGNYTQMGSHELVESSSSYVANNGVDESYIGLSNPCPLPVWYGDQDYSTTLSDDHDFHGHELMMSHSTSSGQEKPENGASLDTKTPVRVRGRKRSPATSLVKRKWSEEEDRRLVKLVKQYGVKKWAIIAQKLEGRTAKQCRERWQNHLRPDIKKDSWSEEEEKIFVEAHEELGNRWSEIARRIPGRTENTVKNHWNAAKRRRVEERVSKKNKGSDEKLPTKPKPSSYLQDYIKRNNLYGGHNSNKSSQDKNNSGNNTTPTTDEHHKTATATTTALASSTPISEDSSNLTPLEAWEYEYSSPLITNITCDEEVMFMLNLFNSTHQAHHQPLGLSPPMFSMNNGDLAMASWRGGFGEGPNDHICQHTSNGEFYEYHDHHHLSYNLQGGVSGHGFDGDQQTSNGQWLQQ